jgi:protein involved in temperature-dependent protein secretion
MEMITDDSIRFLLLDAYRRYQESPDVATSLVRETSYQDPDMTTIDVGKHIKNCPAERQ